ncbi:hypothetical protein EHZ19_28290 [Paraburkholderia bannensis]|nr:hypothetical protein [Paraburkholderia bannensis]RQM44551.1 hypothetical protein EHZ19_28290 [Paraburkholderia bannensis]
MSTQFVLFDAQSVDALDQDKLPALNFRPANMRTVHGVRGNDEFPRVGAYSVSCVHCVEEYLFDGQFVRESGGGMDAPEEIPIGSVKAMFVDEPAGVSYRKRLTGLCQRTHARTA